MGKDNIIDLTVSFVLTVLILFISFGFVLWIIDKQQKVETEIVEEKHYYDVGEIKTIACYYPDGSGPAHKCPAIIRCFSKADTNAGKYEIKCPIF